MAIWVAVPVGQATADALVGRLAPKVRTLKIGPGTDVEAEMGPLVTREHADQVQGYIDAGVAEGAELVVDGRGLNLQGDKKGFFVGGPRFGKVTPDMPIYGTEVIGQVPSVAGTESSPTQ